jgi:twitching motility protein PilT
LLESASQAQFAPAKGETGAPVAAGDDEDAPSGLKIKRGAMIGSILVDNGLMTDEQRFECLRIQAKSGESRMFGEIAVQLGYVTKEVLDRALKAQKRYVNNVHAEQSRTIRVPPEVLELKQPAKSRKKSDSSTLIGWLGSALSHGSSNLHLMAGKPLVLRHQGKLVESKNPPLDPAELRNHLLSILDEEEQKKLETERCVVKCVDLPGGGRARCNIFNHLRGMNGVFRLIPAEVPSIVALNLPQILAKFTTYAQGLVLVTGPISSGKTTTLASIIEIINKEREHHILTIEKPIEFVAKCKKSLITQREVGVHTETYADALRAALREDPDVIVVGEMSDLETTRLTMTAAETGHLVFATLHTQNAVRSINRLLDMFPTEEQSQVLSILAESLRGVISQTLVPRNDVPGLIPVVEVLVTTPAIRNMIRDRKIHLIRNAMKISIDAGNVSLVDYAEQMLKKELISKETYAQICQR